MSSYADVGPEPSAIFLPTKQDPNTCALCPKPSQYPVEAGHRLCTACYYGRYLVVVAGDAPRRRTNPIQRKAVVKPPAAVIVAKQQAQRQVYNAKRRPQGRHGPTGTVYACATPGCANRLVVRKGRGATADWCVACMYARRKEKQRARYHAQRPA